jgi:hypothetical protein
MRRPALRPHIGQLKRGVRILNRPEPAFFVVRLVRKGPFIPALIWRECPFVIPEPLEEFSQPPDYWCRPIDPWRGPVVLRARIGDDEADPYEVWERGRIDPVILETGQPAWRVYEWRMGLREWALTHAPAQPEAQPRQPVRLEILPSLF